MHFRDDFAQIPPIIPLLPFNPFFSNPFPLLPLSFSCGELQPCSVAPSPSSKQPKLPVLSATAAAATSVLSREKEEKKRRAAGESENF